MALLFVLSVYSYIHELFYATLAPRILLYYQKLLATKPALYSAQLDIFE